MLSDCNTAIHLAASTAGYLTRWTTFLEDLKHASPAEAAKMSVRSCLFLFFFRPLPHQHLTITFALHRPHGTYGCARNVAGSSARSGSDGKSCTLKYEKERSFWANETSGYARAVLDVFIPFKPFSLFRKCLLFVTFLIFLRLSLELH